MIFTLHKNIHISVQSILDVVLGAIQCGKTTAQTALKVKLQQSQIVSL